MCADKGWQVEEGHLPYTAHKQLPFCAEEVHRPFQWRVNQVPQQLSRMEQLRELFQKDR